MKISKVVFILLFISTYPFVGLAQDTIDSKDIIEIDTALTFTRYTTLPLRDKPLQKVDKSIDEIRHVNSINKIDNIFYQQLSTDGSPHKPLLFQIPSLDTYTNQPSIYDAFVFTKENIKFYNVYKPYSELRYSNTINTSRYFSAIHAQNIYKNIHLGFQYDVNYTDGSFDKSQIMNQFFNTTLRFKNKKETYEAFLGFIRNRAMQNESGGIKSDSSFRVQEFSSLSAYPVNLNMAYSKWKSVDAFLVQKLNFGKLIKDSSLISNLSLVHELSFFSNSRIYNDQNPTEGFYQNIYFDSITSYDSLSSKRLQNIISIKNGKTLPFEAGIKHDLLLMSDTLNKEKSSLFTPFVNLGINTKQFQLNFNTEYVISNSRYKNDFQIKGDIAFKNIYADVKLINKEVDFFYNNYATNNFIWNNKFAKMQMFNTRLGYKYKDNLSINLGYFHLNNLVYISQNLSPSQTQTPTNILQATLYHKFKIWRLNFRGIIAIQDLSSEEALRLPLFQTKQSISIDFRMFQKKLHTQIGFDFRYNTAYFADSYIPSMGTFVHQNTDKTGNYLYTDFFIQAEVQRVKFFVSLTHPLAGVFGNEYYLTPHYPSEKLNLRYGVTWMFFD